jgi:formate dehydrogenase major subunit
MPKLNMDGKDIEFDDSHDSLLDVARSADIYIPTLCDHPELPAHGGCRLCLVEVEGMRGFPTACTTPPKEGMVVKTTSDELLNLKKSIVQLLMIEHPSACIVCDQWNFCQEYRTSAHKSGAVTGCNTCPNRSACELRNVLEYIGIVELDYEPTYRNHEIERSDPFFDRDYNICVVCGRCVRVCEDIRGTGAITFSQRGHDTRVDTAFGQSHIESGCWFCGACIDVCPTGALSPRMTKWHGAADTIVESTCMLCGTGCQIEVDVKWDRVMATNPASHEKVPNRGHLCILGRFCIPSLNNAQDRIRYPRIDKDGTKAPTTWEEAFKKASKLLQETDANKIGILGSPHLTTEAAFLLHKLNHDSKKSPNVDFRGSDFPVLLHNSQVLDRLGSLDDLEKAKWILVIGGDFVKTHQVVAKACYQAVREGAPLLLLGDAGINLQRWAAHHEEIDISKVDDFLKKLKSGKTALPEEMNFSTKENGAIIIGSGVFQSKNPEKIIASALSLLGESGHIYPTFEFGNELGVTKAGLVSNKSLEEIRSLAKKGGIETLYILDGSIPITGFESVSNVIYQSPYPSDWNEKATVILPSATFPEDEGSIINMEGNELMLNPSATPPGDAKKDWQIILELGNQLGLKDFDFVSIEAVKESFKKTDVKIDVNRNYAVTTSEEWNPQYRGAVIGHRIRDLAVFQRALPERDRKRSRESIDEFVKRFEAEKEVA